jgi:Cu/Ag efflux protein CusF
MTALRISLSLMTGLFVVAAVSADEARGRIVEINPDKKEVRLEARGLQRGSMLDLKIDAKTKIFIGGQEATLKDLSPGRRIRVVFEMRDGKPVAQVIRSLGLNLLQPPPPPAAPKEAPALKEGEGVSGTLQRVAVTDGEIVIVGPGAKGAETETTIQVPDDTPILRDGKKIAFDDLKEGEKATVKTEKRKGKLTAVSIHVGQAAGAAPAAPPRRNLIPRLRQALKMADEVLRQMEERGTPPVPVPPPPPVPDRP